MTTSLKNIGILHTWEVEDILIAYIAQKEGVAPGAVDLEIEYEWGSGDGETPSTPTFYGYSYKIKRPK